jgi:hypothetical protein
MDGLVVNTGSYGAVEAGSGRMYGSSSHGLVIQGSGTTNDFLFLGSDGSDSFRIANNGDISFYEDTGTTAKLFWDASAESLGIGTSSPSEKLQVEGTVSATGMKIGANGTDINSTFLGASSLIAFKCNGTERIRIDSSGNLLVGATASDGDGISLKPRASAGATSQINFDRASSATTGYPIVFQNGGVDVGFISHNNTSTTYNTSSDQRLKENIADADDAGSKIDAIQVRKYDWKADGSHQDYGMIAQELQAVAPEAVSGDADSEEMMGVDYSKLVPMLIKEIQSLRNRVAQLEE